MSRCQKKKGIKTCGNKNCRYYIKARRYNNCCMDGIKFKKKWTRSEIFSYLEISKILRISVGEVRRTEKRALAKMKNKLENRVRFVN